VLRISVLPGQEVQAGDTLVELARPDLTLRMNEVLLEIDALQGRTGLSTAGIDQKVAEVQADLQSRRNSLSFEIDKLKTEYARNQEIASKLKSLPSASLPAANGSDPMNLRIQNLERELQMVEQSAQNQIRLLRGSRGLQHQSGKAELEAKQRELALLQAEQNALTMTANGAWVVASVNVRDGERVSSFEPLLTLTRRTPSMVRGFIQEKVYYKVQVGDSVEVRSAASPRSKVHGVIIGMGSRIVELPVRLRKVPEIQVYGREVIIRIPEENAFLLGELTAIRMLSQWPEMLPQEKK
jgi:multidrug resistance efflux pump